MLITRDLCYLIVFFQIVVAVVLSVHTCVMVYWWPISSMVFHRIMTYLLLTKHLMVCVSAVEGATKFKMPPFICIGPFRCSHAHFEGMLPKKQYHVAQLRDLTSV